MIKSVVDTFFINGLISPQFISDYYCGYIAILLPALFISDSSAQHIMRLYSSSRHSVMKRSQMLKLHNMFCNNKVYPDTVK